MQASNSPDKITLPFAESGAKQTIPVDSQIGIEDGRASYTDGFPPVTRTPIAAGGVPPFGTDFNGLFYAITNLLRWQNSGGTYTYDEGLSTAIGGYPRGAVLQKADGTGLWFCTQDDNTADPDDGGAGWVDLTPGQNIAVFDTDGVTNWSVPDVLKNGHRKARVTVTGGGGGASENGSANGGSGGSSSFGTYISVPGGIGGGADPGLSSPNGSVGTGGALNLRGGGGGSGAAETDSNSKARGGMGGGSYWGGGGRSRVGSGSQGSAGQAPGSGAAGAASTSIGGGLGGGSASGTSMGLIDLSGVSTVSITVGEGGASGGGTIANGAAGLVIVEW